MINRAALIVKYKQPVVDWINSVDPSDDLEVMLEEANEDRTVYLVDEEAAENLEMMLKRKALFETISDFAIQRENPLI